MEFTISSICRFVSFAKFGTFGAITSFKYSFNPTLISLSLSQSGTPIIQVLHLLSHRSFFKSLFSLLFRLDDLYYSVLKFTNSILCHCHSTN